MMDLNTYQTMAGKAADYPDKGTNLGKLFLALGLLGEAGDLADQIKDLIRDVEAPDCKNDVVKDLGDVLWYVAGLAQEFDIDLETVAFRNLELLREMNRMADESGT